MTNSIWMKSICLFICLTFALLKAESQNSDYIIPYPSHVQSTGSEFRFSDKQVWMVASAEQQQVVKAFVDEFQLPCKEVVISSANAQKGAVTFVINKQLNAEAYKLIVTAKDIRVESADNSGLFYALQSIRQLLPNQVEAKQMTSGDWKIPTLIIEDNPRFEYRGLMLDPSRFFIPKENVLKIIDVMALLKLNKLHFHLVDDNGWRLEIKKHPKLTEVGAWRVDRKEDFPGRHNPKKGEPTPVGGFYTQDDIREIVKYASERMIEVIPEIEMPAHSVSALAAYPNLACPVVDQFIGVIPGIGGPQARVIYCAGNDDVFHLLEDVMDEVMELFPSKFIHLGGDEAQKYYWEKCPKCQQRMKDEHLANEEDLQGYFMSRVNSYIQARGRKSIGWDEVTNSKIPDNMVVLGWQGLGSAAMIAAERGHQFIMTPARKLYFIRYQGPQWFEPYTYFGNNTLKGVYDYNPVQPEWNEAYKKLLLGVQGSMWTEFCWSAKDVEYQLFPRTLALAEIAWTGDQNKNWESFLVRIDEFVKRLDVKGITHAQSMFNLDHAVKNENGKLLVSLSTERPDLEIRYTTDGSEPSLSASLYSSELVLDNSTQVKAASFKDGAKKGETLILDLAWNKATAKKAINAPENAYLLTNGLRGSDRHSDFEWMGWYEQDGSFIMDLEEEGLVKEVILGTLTNYSMGVHKPKELTLSISSDNITYKELKKIKFSDKQIFRTVIEKEDLNFSKLNVKGRYLKIEFKNPGLSPDGNVREGTPNWVYFDEIIVN